jgi:hypothetical protein
MVPSLRPARPLVLLAALIVAGCSGEAPSDRRPVDEGSMDAPRRSQGLESRPMDAPLPAPRPVEPQPEATPPTPQPEPKPEPAAQPETAPPTPQPVVPPAEPSQPAAETPPSDEVKHWVEYWEGTKTPKYKYEMRKGADGRWARNGFAQAFYQNGVVEREGHYRNNKRVGIWTYFKPDGTILRTEDRGEGEGNEPDTSK